MIPDDPHVCKVLACVHLDIRTLEECEESNCCWHYVRRREEDRERDRARDERERKTKEGAA